jgi:CheY-like chemotaxis protein
MAKPLRVLVVEDEMASALMIEDMLVDLGHEVVALAMRLGSAIQIAEAAEIDFAILDVNLDGSTSFPVADVLHRRGVRFTFASGYGSRGLEPAYRQHAMIRKPFDLQTLRRAIDALAA